MTVHHRNLQFLVTEIFKVFNGIAPFMQDVFKRHGNAFAEKVSSNTRSKLNFYNPSNPRTVKYGLEMLTTLGPKLWEMIPVGIRNSISLSVFKTKIKTWVPHSCLCKVCAKTRVFMIIEFGGRVVTGEGMCKVVVGVGWVVGLGLGGGIFTFALTSSAFYLLLLLLLLLFIYFYIY